MLSFHWAWCERSLIELIWIWVLYFLICPVSLWREERRQCIDKDGADFSWLGWSQALGNRGFYPPPPPHPDHRRILFVMESTWACAPVPSKYFDLVRFSLAWFVFALQHTDTSGVRCSTYTNKQSDYTRCDLSWGLEEFFVKSYLGGASALAWVMCLYDGKSNTFVFRLALFWT